MAETHTISRQLRTVLRWQLLVTIAFALVAGLLAEVHGAVSAALGGAVSFSAGWASAWVARTRKGESAGGILITALKAEGVKLGVIALLLWLVLAAYREVVVLAFLGTFLATMLVFSMAIFVRDNKQPES